MPKEIKELLLLLALIVVYMFYLDRAWKTKTINVKFRTYRHKDNPWDFYVGFVIQWIIFFALIVVFIYSIAKVSAQ